MKEGNERQYETEKDTRQHRMTDRGTDPGTSEPGVPSRAAELETTEEETAEQEDGGRSSSDR